MKGEEKEIEDIRKGRKGREESRQEGKPRKCSKYLLAPFLHAKVVEPGCLAGLNPSDQIS